jgi:hypothetical protein
MPGHPGVCPGFVNRYPKRNPGPPYSGARTPRSKNGTRWDVRVTSIPITPPRRSGLGGRAPRNARNVTALWSSLDMAGGGRGHWPPFAPLLGGIWPASAGSGERTLAQPRDLSP